MVGKAIPEGAGYDPSEQDLRANAREFFSRCDSLLVWRWDDAVPGGCHPNKVAGSYLGRGLLPAAVSKESPDFFPNRLNREWTLSGEVPATKPTVTVYRDGAGGVLWHIDFAGMTPDERTVVGRAILRSPVCGSWDLLDRDRPYPGGAKICYLNSAGDVDFDPTSEALAARFERLDPVDDVDINFFLIWRHGADYYAWMTREGFIVDVTPHGSDTTFRATYAGAGGGSREIEYLGPCEEEEFLSRNHAFEILMRFFANHMELPVCDGLGWRKLRRNSSLHEESNPGIP